MMNVIQNKLEGITMISGLYINSSWRGEYLVNIESNEAAIGDNIKVYQDRDDYIDKNDNFIIMKIINTPESNIVAVAGIKQ